MNIFYGIISYYKNENIFIKRLDHILPYMENRDTHIILQDYPEKVIEDIKYDYPSITFHSVSYPCEDNAVRKIMFNRKLLCQIFLNNSSKYDAFYMLDDDIEVKDEFEVQINNLFMKPGFNQFVYNIRNSVTSIFKEKGMNRRQTWTTNGGFIFPTNIAKIILPKYINCEYIYDEHLFAIIGYAEGISMKVINTVLVTPFSLLQRTYSHPIKYYSPFGEFWNYFIKSEGAKQYISKTLDDLFLINHQNRFIDNDWTSSVYPHTFIGEDYK